MQYKLIYGRYLPQSSHSLSKIKQHIKHHHLNHLHIEDIELIDVALNATCEDENCSQSHPTNDTPFAALISCPSDFQLNQKKIVTVAWERMGWLALIFEERFFFARLTKRNWKYHIDYRRALKKAQKLM